MKNAKFYLIIGLVALVFVAIASRVAPLKKAVFGA